MSQTNKPRVGADDYWDAQDRALDALTSGEYDLVVLRTGYAGGKTLLGSDWIHQVAVQHAQSDNLVMAPDYQKGGPATYKTFFQRLPGDNTVPAEGGDPTNSPIVAEYNRNEKRVTYVNRAVARLGSADKWNRYAGSEFNAIYCDEPAHYDTTNLYELTEMLTSRQRTPQGPNVMLWTSTGAGYDQYYDITERQVTQDGDPLPWADRMKVIVGDSRDNIFLPDDAREKLERQFAGTEREAQALAGGFAAPEGLVYSQFSRKRHVVDRAWVDDHVDETATPIYGYDAGWDHPRVLIQFRPTHRDQWVATKCYYESEREFEHLCDPSDGTGWVYDQDIERGQLYGEHEPEHLQKFSRAGFSVTKANKDLDEGIPHVRGLLGNSERESGLFVADWCTELIQEFQSYKEEHVGKSGDVPDHCLDSARYALYTHAQRGSSSSVRRSGSMSDLL